MRWGSVCTGYGGLDMAAVELLGGEPAWVADNDPAASKVLAHHWPAVPNLGDITAVDWSAVEPVDGMTGGTPCQDLSTAGKRAGMRAGTRSGLWHAMCDAIEVLRPRLVLWENVRGALSARADSAVERCPGCVGDGDDGPVLRALGRVLGDLSSLGYDAVWCCLPAAAVGCAHLRWRVFVAAADSDSGECDGREPGALGGPVERASAAGGREVAAADAEDLGREGCRSTRRRWTRSPDRGDIAAAHADLDELPGQRLQQPGEAAAAGRGARAVIDGGGVDWRDYGPAIRQHERLIGRPAPPTIVGKRGGPKLSPYFTEWLMGLPEGHVTAVPGLSVNDQLRLCGNGVVRQQAVAAYRYLLPLLFAGTERVELLNPTPGSAEGVA